MTRRNLHSLPAAITVAGLLAGLVLIGLHGAAYPHQAPTGWEYPFACCANFDCKQVQSSEVIEGASGYEIRKTHELIPMTDPKVKMSPDGRFHLCSVGGLDDSRTICLFVPGRGA